MADSKAETVTLRLEQQIDAAADAATGALGRLERQIGREENALGRLEKSLVDAQRKLSVMSEGAVDKRAVAAYEKQAAAVGLLAQRLAAGKTSAEQLAAAQAKLAAMKDTSAAKSVDVSAYRKQEAAIVSMVDKIGAQRDKLGGIQEKLAAAKLSPKSAGPSAADSAAVVNQLSSAVAMLSERSGVASGQTMQLWKQLAAIGPYGAIAAGAILMVTGAVTAFVSIVAKGISSAGAMRSELLDLQSASVTSTMGMHWLFNATRESTAQAEKMQASIDKVSNSSALARSKLADYGAQIIALRFRGKDAETVLKAMATAGAKSDEAAKSVLNMATAYRFAGRSVDDLAKRVEDKLGRTAMAKAIALDVQMRRLGENITWIFGGADLEPFLKEVNDILGIFNKGSDSALTMRNAITKLVEWSIGAMLDMEAAVLTAYIALREHDSIWKALVFTVKLAAAGVGIVVAGLTIAVGVVVALGMALMGLQLAIVGAVGYLLSEFQGALEKANRMVIKFGPAIVDGIADGITKAGDKIWLALKSVVGGAVAKVKGLLGIASPSKVGVEIGHNFGASIGLGETRAESAVVGASEHMTRAMVSASAGMVSNDTAPVTVQTTAPSVSAAPPASGHTVTFTGCTFGSGVNEHDIKRWVIDALEGDSVAGRAA